MGKLSKIHLSTGKTDKSCAVCATKNAEGVYRYDYGDSHSIIYRCRTCGHMYIYPVPLQDLESRSMDTVEDAHFFGNTTLQNLYKALIIDREIRTAKRLISAPKPRLLDIGCGTGWITSLWQKAGFAVTGLESSGVRANVARETHGLEIITKHIENYDPQEKFDIVIMRHLLEHIEKPNLVIPRVRTFLKPGGVLLIVIPNIDSIGRFVFRENFEWVLPWHLHFYNPRNLSRLLIRHHFEKIKIYQTPSPLWYPAAMARAAGENSFFGKIAREKGKILPLLMFSPLMLLGWALNLNDNMTLFFRKPADDET